MTFINVNYQKEFSDYKLESLFDLKGELLSQDSISDVIRVKLNNNNVILKRYYKPGKRLIRSLAGISSLTSKLFSKSNKEFSNLLYFANNGFNTPEIIYFSENKGKSCLITKVLENSQDLASYYSSKQITKDNFIYLLEFIAIISSLHNKGFIHRDYKLRNVILGEDGKLYLIDCPEGFLDYFSIFAVPFYNKVNKFLISRDLAAVCKDLKKVLSARQMLALYKHYHGLGNKKITNHDKANIANIVNYYK